ncbi:single-stranded DNA-binding protein 4 isoform X3 [Pteropus vampyrus]|uniref:Single-stranded DNA-binding protein 4 isoform X3 n=1 Tax=Pteropus vampyrus TaxID=132908 RepID=A0A6P6CU18_PTEVA|nr:single-stranded DNA-binding protein 4 isoform X3 [Pteropus vampyrus]
MCMSTCCMLVPRSQPRPFCLRSDGRRTSRWGSPQASCIPGGVCSGTCTVQHLIAERHVSTRVRPRPSRTTLLEERMKHWGRKWPDQALKSPLPLQSAAAAPSPVMGSMGPNDAMAAGPMAPGFFQGPPGSQPPSHNLNAPMMGPHVQPPVGLPGSQPLLPGAMDPSPRAQGHPSMGPMQRVTPPRGMANVGPQSYGAGMRPPPNSLTGPGLPTMNMASGVRGPWASPSGNSIPYSSSSPGSYTGPPGGGGPPGTPIMPSPGDSTNSSENMYTIMNPMGPGTGRANFPLGPGSEGPMAAMSALEPHHVNGSLGSGDMDGLPKSSPGAVAGLSTAPGTPRDDGEMAAAGTFLHPFPSESVSDCVDSPPAAASGRRGLAGRPRRGGRGARARP